MKREAQKMRDAGVPVSAIAKRFRVSRGTIRNHTAARKRRTK